MPSSEPAETSGILDFRHYVTAFVDLLGSSTRLAALSGLVDQELTESDKARKIQESIGATHALRSSFEDFYGTLDGDDIRKNEPVTSWDEEVALASLSQPKRNVTFHYFSDSVAISIPIDVNDPLRTAAGISWLFRACAAASVRLLGRQQLCRGGIELGMSALVYDGEVLGASLANAHQLEQDGPGYPRIVVGPELTSYLLSLALSPLGDTSSRYARRYARSAFTIVARDSDSTPFIDFLNQEVLDCMAAKEKASLKPAYDWALESLDRFQNRSGLLQKYYWLSKYLEKALDGLTKL